MIFKRSALALLAMALSGCADAETGTTGSGKTITDKRSLQGEFEKISLSVPANITVEVGKSPASVELTGDDNIVKLFTTKIQNGVLVVDTDNKHFNNHNEIRIAVTAPVLKAIDMSGAGKLDIENVQGDSFDISLTGACEGKARGKLDNLSATMTGAGNLNLADLECKSAKLNVSGAGTAVVSATKSLDVDVSGAASVKYKGHPANVTKNISGVASLVEWKG